MSEKVLDAHGRWRNITVAFRVSPEEDEQIERLVKLTGLTKQDYIIRRLTEQDVVVQGNPKVFAALRREMKAILDELSRLNPGDQLKWVGIMNTCKAQVEEIICNELIYED